MNKLFFILALFLFTSCAVYTPDRVTVTYDFNAYNYNAIHNMWLANPWYFYNTTYIDQYGIRYYYYQHPYFVRYCTYRNFTPNHNYYINNRGRSNQNYRYTTNRSNRSTTPRMRTTTRQNTSANRGTSNQRVNRSTNVRRQNTSVRRSNPATSRSSRRGG